MSSPFFLCHDCMIGQKTGHTQQQNKQTYCTCTQTHKLSQNSLSLFCWDFQTPENGTAEKRSPAPKATPTPRASANKNGSSATAANKTPGTCTHTHTHLHSLDSIIISVISPVSVPSVTDGISSLLWLLHSVSSATWPLQQDLNSL